jgi:hypothetical protein
VGVIRLRIQQVAPGSIGKDIQAFKATDHSTDSIPNDENVIVEGSGNRFQHLYDTTPREPYVQHAAPRWLQRSPVVAISYPFFGLIVCTLEDNLALTTSSSPPEGLR